MPTLLRGFETLIDRLDAAVRLGEPQTITAEIKRTLQQLASTGGLPLDERFRQAPADRYARRLLHRNPQLGYSIVVMTWGPAQRTPLHDHAGIWCVECVVAGELDVTQYDMVEQDGDRCRFESRSTVRAAVGDAGCLIPPFEYHVLANARDDASAITLHVYGGEMDHCNVYLPDGDGAWQRSAKRLSYD
ncbi:MAG TPA: cysteine dioxygenase family protein [Candidatus Polarisedimenticolaceae bacterium]|nr:cysteine dioxygenase family protein [Candidatus Polarisedimenticolaceae bacterium]